MNCGSNCGPYGRRYLNKEERLGLLRDYEKELEAELKGVKERIDELNA